MSISSVSNANVTPLPVQSFPLRQSEEVAGRQLEQALQSGDLASATQAYNKLASFGANNSGPFKNPALKAEFAAVGQALASGDLGAAKSAVNTLGSNLLQQDLQTVQQDYQKGGINGAAHAIADLEGDYWAVTGQGNPVVSPSASASGPASNAPVNASAISVQA